MIHFERFPLLVKGGNGLKVKRVDQHIQTRLWMKSVLIFFNVER